MVVAVPLALLLIAGAVFAVVAQRRRRDPDPAEAPRSPDPPRREGRVDAERLLDRLGGSLAGLDAGGDRAAGQALADAAERCRAAREQLVEGRYAQVGHTALEGLHYVRAARTALRLDPGPVLPGLGTPAVTARDGRVVVETVTYVVSNRWRDATPYYYAGGEVGGRRAPTGWYSAPWWAAATPVAAM
ncbi:MAG: hypothetical protein HOV70_32600 [Streptomyces sp.]|nr:hypothetical protein [Streptomyces sp.]